jgi:hypothetical protein
MDEGENQIEVTGATSVRGDPRTVYLTRGQPGRVVMTIRVGQKPIAVVLPIKELRERLAQIDRQ